MAFLSLLLGALSSLSGVFKEILALFKKTPEKKIEDGKVDIDKKVQDMKDTGRG